MYQRIRDLREDRDLTQTQVAKMLGMSQTGYSKYETGENDIPTDILIKLANFYVQGDSMGFWDLDSAQIYSGRAPLKGVVRDLGRLMSSFILTIDDMPETKKEFMDAHKIADVLAKAYGIDAQTFLPSYYSYWLKKIKLKHDFG